MSTTLPLYWNLSSPAKEERIEASVKLMDALQTFQHAHTNDSSELDTVANDISSLDTLNSQDVAYALRRLVRGLASPRESSRLGFAVMLSEILSRLDTITSGQMIDLVLSSSEFTGSMSGQEERDMMFARLFGLISVAQSGLLVREATLSHTSSVTSTLQDYQRVVMELISLGERKAWFRESCWWGIILAINVMSQSKASFAKQGIEWTFGEIFVRQTEWTPEKIAIWLRFQSLWGSTSDVPLKSMFKGKHPLALSNLPQLAKILKESQPESEEDDSKINRQSSSGSWSAHPHFVWGILFDSFFTPAPHEDIAPFQDFFRITVDEVFFSTSASPERKFTGFQLIEAALKQSPPSLIPYCFTRNFIRTWINQLSKKDRYVHKAAVKLASTVQDVVKRNPSTGFPLVMQLLGSNGSRDFDRITNTKTIEVILGNMTLPQIVEYVQFLQHTFQGADKSTDKVTIESDQKWALEQASSLIRSNIVTKHESWVNIVLELLVRYGYYSPNKKKSSSTLLPSEMIKEQCRSKLHSALADLSSQAVSEHQDSKTSRFNGRTSNGDFWVSEVLDMFLKIGKSEDLGGIYDLEENATESRKKALRVVKSLGQINGEKSEVAQGALLLLSSTLLQSYDAITEDNDEDPIPALEHCTTTVSNLLQLSKKKSKKTIKSDDEMEVDDEPQKPIDLLVDDLIGYLEKPKPLMRAITPQVFSLICSEVEGSTIELLLTQLERRNVLPDASSGTSGMVSDESKEGTEDDGSSDTDDSSESTSEEAGQSENDISEDNDEVDPELRQKIATAIESIGLQDSSRSDSDDESSEMNMDDDQMMQLDEKLADIFRTQSLANKAKTEAGLQREATHFKIRVLDLLDIFIRKCPQHIQVPRLVLPLVQTALEASADEQQLIEKINGLLRKRIGSLQQLPEDHSATSLAEDLQELHNIARKSSSQQLSQETLLSSVIYLSKVLVHNKELEVVVKTYQQSLEDFIKRKGSKLWPKFFVEFIKRLSLAAWAIRLEFIKFCSNGEAINSFRQTQAVQWLSMLLPLAVQHATEDKDESLSMLKSVRKMIYQSIKDATMEQKNSSVTHVKLLLKVAIQAARATSNVDQNAVSRIWNPPELEKLLSDVKASETLGSSSAIQNLMQQLAAKFATSHELTGKETKAESKKRKLGDGGTIIQENRKRSKKTQKPSAGH